MSDSGLPFALGLVGALAAVGTLRRRGSRDELEGQAVGQTEAKANVSAMWTLAAEKLYGSYVDVPVISTREALQNSRDAIRQRVRARQMGVKDGVFRVSWDPETRTLGWEDNGVGMSQKTVDTKFLSLGDTTKIVTANRQEVQAGGFGLAKAVLLGASQNFHWTLHTLDRRWVARGFDQKIAIRTAPFLQGTQLVVEGVASKHDRAWVDGVYRTAAERISAFLATNDLPFQIFFNGVEVPSAFSGRAKRVDEGIVWGPGTTGEVRVYRRGRAGGRVYVRLFGLTQFSHSLAGGEADFDVVVDLETSIAPTQDGYPFTASRMELSGPAREALDRLVHQFSVDQLSKTKEAFPQIVGADTEADEVLQAHTEAQFSLLLQGVSDDPEIQAMLAGMVKTGAAMRTAFAQVRRQVPSRATAQQARSTAGEAPAAFAELVRTVNTEGAPAPAPSSAPTRRGDGVQNPFSGVGTLKVNRTQWTRRRLAPYLRKPEALLPLLALWRLTIQMVCHESRGSVPRFTVGFLFDDDVRAEYDAKRDRLFCLNPVPVIRLVRTVPDNPEVVASYVLNKACHEVTHMMGYGDHNEPYVAMRQTVADQTAQLLAPLTLLTARLLGMRAPPRSKVKPPRKRPALRTPMERRWGDQYWIEGQGERSASPLFAFALELARLWMEAGGKAEVDETEVTPSKATFYLTEYDQDGEDWSYSCNVYLDDLYTPHGDRIVYTSVLTDADRAEVALGKPVPLATRVFEKMRAQAAEHGFTLAPPRGSRALRLPRSRPVR